MESLIGSIDDHQEGAPSGWHAATLREASALLTEGFEPAEEGLWKKDGLWYGREAALQHVWQARHEDDTFCDLD
jgi:hypothetical protein